MFNDVLNDSEGHTIGEFWRLSSSIPEEYLPEVLSALCSLSIDEDMQGRRRNEFEVAGAFGRSLQRFFASNLPKQPREIWTWLSVLHRLEKRTVGNSWQDAIKKSLQDNLSLVLSMFDISVEQTSISDLKALFLHDF